MLGDKEFIDAMIELELLSVQTFTVLTGGLFVEGSAYDKQLKQLFGYYQVWLRAKETN